MKPYTNLISAKKFNRLSRKSKRVAICQDVIDRIKAKVVAAMPGNVIHNRYDIMAKVDESHILTLKDAINQNECQVCAKGALCMGWIGNFNKYKSLDKFDVFPSMLPKELVQIFGKDLLAAIEVAFEQDVFYWSRTGYSTLSEYTLEKISGHFKKTDDNKRLIDIMQNIIKNKGVLVVGEHKIG